MRKSFFIALTLLSSFALLQGCIKDTWKSTYTYTYYKPVYKTSAEVRANIKSNAPQAIERPGKIYVQGRYIFLNETDKGIHIIDNSNPAQPVNVAFIDIPGNLDLAVKGNALYADLYTDLVTLDITNPLQVQVSSVAENIFSHRYYGGTFRQDSTKVIAGWEKRDTTVTDDGNIRDRLLLSDRSLYVNYTSANHSGATASVAPYGVGGSMARFTIVNDRLYTVGTQDLNVFSLANAAHPVYTNQKNIGWNIETIYPFKNRLFIGSSTGMFFYSIDNPDNPVLKGQFTHARSCDPVIADDQYAYVTLRSGSMCGGVSNQLDIVDVGNLLQPLLKKTYSLTNPHGLSKDGDMLFICDGAAGLKVYNAADAGNLQLLQTIEGIDTYDVIAFNKVALVVAKDGLYQYDYADRNNIRLLSKITILNQ